jgi:hypothetical protein
MLEDLPPLFFARARCLCGAFLAFYIGDISVHLQCHNACRLAVAPCKSTPPISTPGWPRFWLPIRSQRA